MKFNLGQKLKYGLIGCVVGLLIAGLVLVIFKVNSGTNHSITHTVQKDQDTLTIKSLTKEKQIVLVNLGLSEILNEEKSS